MKTVIALGGTFAMFWGMCFGRAAAERFRDWQERRRWERSIFDPSWERAQTALEDMIEGASK